MEINFNVLSNNEVISTAKQNRITLSEDSQSMFFQMFTKNIYSNPIGSVVREITSNCFDSHIEASVNAPVLIKKSYDEQTCTHYISFIDYGVGMSPARIDEVYSVMFKSTKRGDNTQIGGFGLGSKVPLAYKRFASQGEYDNSFYVITVFEGIKYYYCIYEGNESPMISLLHSESTTEKNGTEVKIPVKEQDVSKFTSEMIKQLYYFENVVFEGFGENKINNVTNDYQIIRGKNFLYRGQQYSNVIHVCLGKVAYPIDYSVLGLHSDDYKIPVAIKLEIGDVNVTASRESLDYSEQTIKTLKKRIADVKAELIEMVTKQYESIVTLTDYLKYQNESDYLYFNEKSRIDISSFIKKREITLNNFKYQDLNIPDECKMFKLFFRSRNFGRRVGKTHKFNFHGYYCEITSKKNLLYVENIFKRKINKQSYLKKLHTVYHVIEKRDMYDNKMISEINSVFGFKINSIYTEHDNQPLAIIETMVEMQNEYYDLITKHCENYDKLEIPAEFNENNKSVELESSDDVLLSLKIINGYSSRNTIKLSTLINHKGTIFYGTKYDSQALFSAYQEFRRFFGSNNLINYYNDNSGKFGDKKGGVIFLLLSKHNIKHMDKCKNAFHVNEFSNKMLSRKKDVIIKKMINEHVTNRYRGLSRLFRSNELIKVNTAWGNMVIMLNNYMKTIPINNDDIYVREDVKATLKIPDIENLFEVKRFNIMINKLLKLQKTNEKTLSYFNIPTNEVLDNELVKLLKHALKFK